MGLGSHAVMFIASKVYGSLLADIYFSVGVWAGMGGGVEARGRRLEGHLSEEQSEGDGVGLPSMEAAVWSGL